MSEPHGYLGQALRGERGRRGWTLREAERRCGGALSNCYLSQLETGRVCNPGAVAIDALARLYDMTHSDIVRLACTDVELAAHAASEAVRS